MSKGAEKISDAMEYVDDGIIRETDILRAETARSAKTKNRGKVTNIRNLIVGRVAAAAAIMIVGAGAGVAIYRGLDAPNHKEAEAVVDRSGQMNLMASAPGAVQSLVRDNVYDSKDAGDGLYSGDSEVDYFLSDEVTSTESDSSLSAMDDIFGGFNSAFMLDSFASSIICPVRIAIGETDNNSAEITFIVDVEEEGISFLASNYYIVQKNENGKWVELKEGDIDEFTSATSQAAVGLSIAHTEETAKVVYDWSEKYGSLEHGEYRLVVKLFRKNKSGSSSPFTRKLHFIYE